MNLDIHARSLISPCLNTMESHMNRRITLLAKSALAISLLLALGACGNSENENNNNTSSSLCGENGLEVSRDGADYCVYRSQAITETGFACPGALPHRHDLENISVCAGQDMVPQGTLKQIEQEATIAWDLEPSNNATINNTSPNNTSIGENNTSPNNSSTGEVEVGKMATFVECGDQEQTPEYCAAELLEWSYDASSKTLQLKDARAYMNCCGEREVKAFKVAEATYELRETDDPAVLEDGSTARCGCMCVFDYGIQIPEVEEGVITVRVKRDTSDQEGIELDWEGTLDLSEGSGAETLDTSDTTGFCGEEM